MSWFLSLVGAIFWLFLCGVIIFIPLGMRYVSIPLFRAVLWYATGVTFGASLVTQMGRYFVIVPLLLAAFGLARSFRPPAAMGLIFIAAVVWAIDAFVLYGRTTLVAIVAGEFAVISVLYIVALLADARRRASPSAARIA